MTHLRAQNPLLATATCIGRLFALRTIFHELARTSHLAERAHLLLREDIPRSPHTLPRPFTAEQDQLLQQEFMRRNDLGGNVFLLLRSTGMRIGECVDLSYDCLRSTGPDQWAIHVPLGKLKTERMVPVDAFGRDLVHRLRFFRSLDPLPADGRLLALLVPLRDYLLQVCHSLGLSTSIVPHQFRHTYATEMLRSGVSFPVLMKLLGNVDPGMTMRYVDVALTDLEREFQLARSKPKAPASTTPNNQRTHRGRPRRPHQGLSRRSTHPGDVPPLAHKRQCSQASPQTIHPPHQDPRRDKKTPHHLNENGKRLAVYGDYSVV